MASVFFSYSHKDEALCDQIKSHLALLKNQGLIDAWCCACPKGADSCGSPKPSGYGGIDVGIDWTSARSPPR